MKKEIKVKGKSKAHTINTESITEAFLISRFDKLKIFREDLKSTLHFINGIVSFAVSVSKTSERDSVARFSDDLKKLLLHVGDHPNRIGVMEAQSGGGGGHAEENDKERPLCHLSLSTKNSASTALLFLLR